MRRLRVPDFLARLYRDLRDRRLLLPAVALVIAMLAVPLLLTRHTAKPEPASPPARDTASASAIVPAVARQELGVTNYRRRLDHLASKNPFHQQYAAPPPSAQVHAAPSASAPSSPTNPSAGGTTLPPVSGGGGVSGTTTSPAPVVSPPPSGGTSPGTAPTPSSTPKPTVRVYTLRASVKVGEPHHLKARPNVQRLAMLPTEGKPVVTYLGASEDARQAFFLVGRDVDSVTGAGKCVPNHSYCEYLVMKPGDKASFHYAPNGKRYNLVLVDIHAVDITDKLGKSTKGVASQPQSKASLILPG